MYNSGGLTCQQSISVFFFYSCSLIVVVSTCQLPLNSTVADETDTTPCLTKRLRQLVGEISMDVNLGRRWRGSIAMALRSVEAVAFLVFLVVGFSIFMAMGRSKPLNQIELNTHSSHCNFPAIFNFKVSNFDTGGKSAAYDRLPSPNGDTFFGKPSGRFCDGQLVIDFIGDYSHFPMFSISFGITKKIW